MPLHEPISKSGNPDSIIVGTSGKSGLRLAAVTASALSLPFFIKGKDGGRLSNIGRRRGLTSWRLALSSRERRVPLLEVNRL